MLAVATSEIVSFLFAQALAGVFLAGPGLFLYLYRPRGYFRAWGLSILAAMLGWLCVSGDIARQLQGRPDDFWHALLWYGTLAFGMAHAFLWALGTWQYVAAHRLRTEPALAGAQPQRRAPRQRLLGTLAVSALAALLIDGILSWQASVIVTLAVVVGAFGGSAFAIARARRGTLTSWLMPIAMGLYAANRLVEAVQMPAEPPPASLHPQGLVESVLGLVLMIGLVLGMTVVLLDDRQDDLREALERLGQSEEQLRLLVEHGGVGLALLSPEGYFLHTNPALTRFLGYSPTELNGKRLADLTHPQDRTGSYHRGPGPPGTLHDREKRFVHKDGRDVWARVVRVPVRAADGSVRFHVCVLADVTERHRAEEALAASEQQLRLRFAQAFDGIAVWSEGGAFLEANPALCSLLGHSRPELMKKSAVDVADDPQALRQHLGRVLLTGADRCEMRLRAKSGEVREVEISSAVIETDTHRLIQGICRDVGQRKRAEEAVRRAEKMETLAALVGGIAHDFNNQLTAILGNLSLTLSDLELPPTAHPEVLEALRDAEQAAQRCARMTARLLTFSGGRGEPPRPIDLAPVLVETARLLQRDLPATIQVHVQAAPGTWPVQAEPAQVQELLLNLATNARDAMLGGGTLTLALTNRDLTAEDCIGQVDARPGPFVELRVNDTGQGMSPAVQARIFEPMFSTHGPGRGMGLAVVFGIVRAHKGWVAVESTPGQGTTFHVYLPASTKPAQAPRPVTPAAAPAAHPDGACVLVADDEPLVRELARSVLERAGFRVLTASDGSEALAACRGHVDAIDAVLLDYTMPGLTGLEVLQELRQFAPNLRVVFSSGYALEHEVQQFLDAGARAFLPKPYRPRDLVQAIQRALAQG